LASFYKKTIEIYAHPSPKNLENIKNPFLIHFLKKMKNNNFIYKNKMLLSSKISITRNDIFTKLKNNWHKSSEISHLSIITKRRF